MRLAFISILRRLLGLQFDFLAIICSQVAFFREFTHSAISVFFRGFHLLSRRHRSKSGFPWSARMMDWTVCGWNSKGTSQLLFVVVLVHGLLVILDSRFFSSVEVRR